MAGKRELILSQPLDTPAIQNRDRFPLVAHVKALLHVMNSEAIPDNVQATILDHSSPPELVQEVFQLWSEDVKAGNQQVFKDMVLSTLSEAMILSYGLRRSQEDLQIKRIDLSQALTLAGYEQIINRYQPK